jgi:ClpP class serine protease
MRGEQLKAYLNNKFLAVCPAYLDTLIETANSEEIARIETSNDISPAHSYEEKENVAIITIDGTTVKKNTFMNAISGGFVPYDALYGYRNKAENNPKITDVVWHIDTRGGDVEGVDRLGELIHTSKKNTHTFYSNKGASAGIWYGTASKKRYADETAMLGSIGVMAIMNMPSEGNNNQLVKVSKNAKNKNCMLDGSCAERVEKAQMELFKLEHP